MVAILGLIEGLVSVKRVSKTVSAPSFSAAVELRLLLWAPIVLAGLVVAINLELIEHPLTNNPITHFLGPPAVASI
jgi:hypothetical protein